MNGVEVTATNTAAHTADTPQLLLEHHLKELRLPTILREYDKVARQCSDESVDYPRYLAIRSFKCSISRSRDCSCSSFDSSCARCEKMRALSSL